jgi:hypothetical protein
MNVRRGIVRSLALALGVGVLALSAGQAAFAGGQFKRFPETISPDGAYVLAWGRAPESPDDIAQLTEAAYEDALFDEANQDEEVNNYLVDAVARKALAVIPGFHYFRGPKLNKNRADLAVAWSPDGECALAVLEGRWGSEAVVWIRPGHPKFQDVQKQLEKGFHGVLRKSEPSFKDVIVHLGKPVLVKPDLLVVRVSGTIPKERDTAEYLLRFKIIETGDDVQFRLVSGGKVRPEPASDDHDAEAELNRVYNAARRQLSPKQRDELREAQIRWLKLREQISDEESRRRFTERRVTELRGMGR